MERGCQQNGGLADGLSPPLPSCLPSLPVLPVFLLLVPSARPSCLSVASLCPTAPPPLYLPAVALSRL